MTAIKLLVIVVLAVALTVRCDPPNTSSVVGGTTSQGCRSSAGYRWCASLGQCVRPWEIPALKAEYSAGRLTNLQVDLYCHSSPSDESSATPSAPSRPKVGGADSNGCVGSAGYMWCARLTTCVRPWELPELLETYASGKLTAEHVESFCSASSATPTTPTTPATRRNSTRVGGASDSHGCIGSAGYRWCAKLSSCVRPWEVTELSALYKAGNLKAEDVDNFCSAASVTRRPLGGQKDSNGCLSSAGYLFCAKLGRCVRPYAEPQLIALYNNGGLTREVFNNFCTSTSTPTSASTSTTPTAASNGGEVSDHKCRLNAGFQWCAALGKCTRPWDIPQLSTLHKEGLLTSTHFNHFCNKLLSEKNDARKCLLTAGYVWCETEQKCVRPWELANEKDFANVGGAFDSYCQSKSQ